MTSWILSKMKKKITDIPILIIYKLKVLSNVNFFFLIKNYNFTFFYKLRLAEKKLIKTNKHASLKKNIVVNPNIYFHKKEKIEKMMHLVFYFFNDAFFFFFFLNTQPRIESTSVNDKTLITFTTLIGNSDLDCEFLDHPPLDLRLCARTTNNFGIQKLGNRLDS